MSIRPYASIEIVGLEEGGFGRICGIHSFNCGVAVKKGTYLKLVKSSVNVPVVDLVPIVRESNSPKKRGRPKKTDSQYEEVVRTKPIECMKAFIWKNAIEGCFVGFVSKPFQKIYGHMLDGRVVEIIDIFCDSDMEADRKRSREQNGLALGIIIT